MLLLLGWELITLNAIKRQRGHLLASSPFASQEGFSNEEENTKGVLFSFPFPCKDSWAFLGVGKGWNIVLQNTAFVYDLHLEFERILKTLERHL